MGNHLRQLASDSLIYGVAGIVSRFPTFFLLPVYTRIFSPKEYGIISLVTTTMLLPSIFVVLALDHAAHRWYWETDNAHDRTATISSWLWCQLMVAVALAGLTTFVAGGLGATLIGDEGAGVYLRLITWTLPLNTLSTVTTNWLRMQRRPWLMTIYTLGTSVLLIGLSVLAVVVWHGGLVGVFTAQLVQAGCSALFAVCLLRNWAHPRWFQWRRLREMLRYALPMIPAGLALWVVGFSDRFFVQAYTNTGEVGLYQLGAALAAVVLMLTGAFQQAWLPFALSIHKRPDARQVYAQVFVVYVFAMSFVSAALALLSPEIIRLIATERYLGASAVVGLLAFSYVMAILGNIAAIGPAVVKSTGPTGLAILLAAGLSVVLNFVLTPPLGKVGSALATLLAQTSVPIYLFYRAQRLYPVPYRFRAAIAIFAFAFAVIMVGSSWPYENLWGGLTLKLTLLALFIPVMFLLQIITPSQARQLWVRVSTPRRSVV